MHAQLMFQLGGSIALGYPQGEFKENVDNPGIGGNLHFAIRFPQSPLTLGLSTTFLIYGSERREEPFSTTIPDVWVDVTTTNNLVMAHLLLRLQPSRGAVQPYLDGLLGLNYLWTETRIEDQDDLEEVASSTNFQDATFGYGGGCGLMIRVWHQRRRSLRGDGVQAVLIDMGVRYLKGGKAEYLKKGSIRREDGRVLYDINESTTDILTFRLGAIVNF
jgi:hypothetical protein